MKASCTGCGKRYTVKSTRARTCPACGAEVKTAEAAPAFDVDAMVACPACSALHAPGARRCAECGWTFGERATRPRRAVHRRQTRHHLHERPEDDDVDIRWQRGALLALRWIYAVASLPMVWFLYNTIRGAPPDRIAAYFLVSVPVLVLGVDIAAVLALASRPVLWSGLGCAVNAVWIAMVVRALFLVDEGWSAAWWPVSWLVLLVAGVVLALRVERARHEHPHAFLGQVFGDWNRYDDESPFVRLEALRRKRTAWAMGAIFLVGLLGYGGLLVRRMQLEPEARRVTWSGVGFQEVRPSAPDERAPDLTGPPPERVVELSDAFRSAWLSSDLEGLLEYAHDSRRPAIRRKLESALAREQVTAPWPEPGGWTHERRGESSVASSFECGRDGRVEVTWIEDAGAWRLQGLFARF